MTIHNGNRHRPLISFILTDYNIPEDMLQECVESVMSLDLDDNEREIILVDDGSAIKPDGIISRYGNRLTYFRQQNKGLSAARNAGLSLAKGEYIQFVDGDDSLITESYDRIIAAIKGHADADILMFTASRTKSYDSQTGHSCFKSTTGEEFLMRHNLKASACCYLFRYDILEELRFKEGLLHEDELFTPLLMCRAGNVAYTSDAAYYYRQREESITTRTNDKHTEKRLADFFSIITHLSQLANSDKFRVLRRRVDQLCMDYIYKVVTLHCDFGKVESEVKKMKKACLYPIPVRCYTLKYLCFSLMTRTKSGRKLFFKYAIRK